MKAIVAMLVACLVAAFFPAIAVASEGHMLQSGKLTMQANEYSSGTSGSCAWTLYDDGHLVISPTTGEEGTTGSGELPDTIKPNVVTVSFEGTVHASARCSLFSGCSSLKSVDFTNFDTSKMTSMSGMFSNCHSLESVNLSSLDTSRVTSMATMFLNCTSLTSADLSGLDFSRVEDMGEMFSNCPLLASVVVTNWNTSSLGYTAYMFRGCSSLKTLSFAGFNTSRVTHMNEMIFGLFGA